MNPTSWKLNRRGFVLAGAAAMSTAALMPRTLWAKDAVKLGLIMIDAGPMAAYYESHNRGTKLAVEHVNANGGVNGAPLEIVEVTHPGTPEAAVQAATRLVQREGVNIMTGMFTSSIALALGARAASLKAVVIDPISQANKQTGENCRKNYFRVSTADGIIMGAYDSFLSGSGAKSWDILAVDYTLGQDAAAEFEKLLKKHGKTLGKVLFAPFGTADFGTYISQLSESPADGLFVTIIGSDAINLAKQQEQFGFFKKYGTVLGNGFATPATLPAQAGGVVGVNQSLAYVPAIQNDANARFVAAFKEKFGMLPDYSAADQYLAIVLAAAAMNRAGSSKTDQLIAAMEGLKADTIVGPVEWRAGDHQLIRPVSLNKVVMGTDGKPGYELIKLFNGQDIIPPVNPACSL